MSTSNPILQKIQEKESAMAKALADAAQLEMQIKTLRQTLEMLEPTEYEKYLQSKSLPSKVSSIDSDFSFVDAVEIERTLQKNPKGTLTPVMLRILSDGKVRSIDDVLADVNAQMTMPTTRDSVRATLGTLKSAGKILSPGYGQYKGVPSKGESPTDVVATNDNGGALNVQSSPADGAQ